MKDIPSQYKSSTDKANIALAKAVKHIWMISEELGCDRYEVEIDGLLVIIRKGSLEEAKKERGGEGWDNG